MVVALLTHPATLTVVPLVVVLVVVLARGGWFAPQYDYAAQELAIQEAARGQRLLGPYSHFGFLHPGPLLFYAAVPWYEALGQSGGLAMVLTRLTVDALCVVLIVVLVDRIGGRVAAWGAALGLLWFELRVGLEWFRDPWNPYAVVLPGALALVAAAALFDARGTRARLLVLVVAASYAAQSHLGAGPLAALALVCGLAGVMWTARTTGRRVGRAAALAVAVGVACWSLPIWEQLTTSPGNLRDLRAFLTSAGDTHGLGAVVDPVVIAIVLPRPDAGSVLGPQPFDWLPAVTPAWWCVLAGLLGAAAAAGWRWWRGGRAGLAALAALVPIGALAGLAGALGIRGDLAPYLFAPFLVIAVVAWVVAAAALACAVGRRGGAPGATTGFAIGAVVLAVAVLSAGRDAYRAPGESFGNALVTRMEPAIEEVCGAQRPVRIVTESAQWFDQLALGAAIGECAPDVSISHHLEYIVGSRRAARAREHGRGELRVRLETPRVPLEAGWRRVYDTPEASVDVRAGRPTAARNASTTPAR